jgi:hypothetical protein
VGCATVAHLHVPKLVESKIADASSDHTDELLCPVLPSIQQRVQDAVSVAPLYIPRIVESKIADASSNHSDELLCPFILSVQQRIITKRFVEVMSVLPQMQPPLPPPPHMHIGKTLLQMQPPPPRMRNVITTTAPPPHMHIGTPLLQMPPPPPRMRNVITKEQAVQIFKHKYQKNNRSANNIAKHYGMTAKAVREIWTMRTWKSSTKHLWNTVDQAEYKRLGGGRRIQAKVYAGIGITGP